MGKIFNKLSLKKYIIYFTLVSIAGAFIEIIYVYLTWGNLPNNSNWGPYLQVYGLAVVIVVIIYDIVNIRYKIKPVLFFIACIFLTMGIEFIASWFVEVTEGIRYWDYSSRMFDIAGRTALSRGVEFAVMVCLFMYFIRPLLDKLIKYKIVVTITTVLFIIIILNSITNIFKGLF